MTTAPSMKNCETIFEVILSHANREALFLQQKKSLIKIVDPQAEKEKKKKMIPGMNQLHPL